MRLATSTLTATLGLRFRMSAFMNSLAFIVLPVVMSSQVTTASAQEVNALSIEVPPVTSSTVYRTQASILDNMHVNSWQLPNSQYCINIKGLPAGMTEHQYNLMRAGYYFKWCEGGNPQSASSEDRFAFCMGDKKLPYSYINVHWYQIDVPFDICCPCGQVGVGAGNEQACKGIAQRCQWVGPSIASPSPTPASDDEQPILAAGGALSVPAADAIETWNRFRNITELRRAAPGEHAVRAPYWNPTPSAGPADAVNVLRNTPGMTKFTCLEAAPSICSVFSPIKKKECMELILAYCQTLN